MSNTQLIPTRLLDLFIEAMCVTFDSGFRRIFERQGIRTSEVMALSMHPLQKGYRESLPLRERIERYIETLDLTKSEDVAKLMPVIEHGMAGLQDDLSDLKHRLSKELELHCLEFKNGRIRKLPIVAVPTHEDAT